MLKKLMQTDDDVGMLIVRLALGIVMFPHGAQKLLGWFGGYGYAATMAGMSKMLPAAIVFLVIVFEFFGSLSLITGFLGRIGAFCILCVMVGAVLTVHLHSGFFMNWEGKKPGEGFEYHILAIGMALAIMIKGSGRFSIDRALSEKGAYVSRR